MAHYLKLWDATSIGGAKDAVRLATTAALPAVTAAGAGVGHTLTADANGVLTVDGVAPALNERILIKNQVAADDNGVYQLSTVGTAGVAFVLTRTTDWDQAAAGEVEQGNGVLVSEGTANAGKSFHLTTSGAITVDTTSLTFTEGGGDDASESTNAISLLACPTVGVIIDVDETLAPLTGYIEVQVGNAEAQAGRGQPRSDINWRAYGGLTVAGVAITDGQLDVTGAENWELEFKNLAFGWLRFVWVGSLGQGSVTLTATMKG
jgi:hypothetical protein